MKDVNYLLVSVLGGLLVFYFREHVKKYYKGVLIFDAFGLAVFMSIGISVGLQHNLSYWASILLGMITATFGGVIRDMMASEVPLIFQKELYATLTLIGGGIYVSLYHFNLSQIWIVLISSTFVFIARLCAIKYDLSLPH